MPMARHTFPPLCYPVLVLLLAVFAVSARATTALPPSDAEADRRFLRECCANTSNAAVCYDSLLPSAGSFHGNHVKVALAAGAGAFVRLRGFYHELRRLQRTGTGAGRAADMALGPCVTIASMVLQTEGDWLASLRRLETAAGRRRGEQAKSDLFNAQFRIGAVGSAATGCTDDLESCGEAVLASPVGKKVAAIVKNVDLYSVIAQELVINGITLLA
ncbi:hypothetical protein ACP70R_044777 [Stipagrostis hirtigluma subsp. patula]